MRIGSIMWASYVPMLVNAARNLEFVALRCFSTDTLLDDPLMWEEALTAMGEQEVILLYRTADPFWDEIEERLKETGRNIPIVCMGHDPSYWTLSTVRPQIVASCRSYTVIGGEVNYANMLRYIAREVLDLPVKAPPPEPVPWEGLYHPDAPHHFDTISDYLEWYQPGDAPLVGLLFSRHYWVNRNTEVEDALVRELEARGLGVIPAFSYALRDANLGCKGSGEVVRQYFLDGQTSRIDALVKTQAFFLARHSEQNIADTTAAQDGVELLKRLGVPVMQPVSSSRCTQEEWRANPQGLGNEIAWSMAMPEFEGTIEPIIVGMALHEEDMGADLRRRVPVEERCGKVAQRVANWVRLRRKPAAERRVAFILHNNPCASVEATVGGGAHLDTLESTARVMQRMQEAGYRIDAPDDGQELIKNIMEHKAISEFRWTTVDEIVTKGGALALVGAREYQGWFDSLAPRVRESMAAVWGNPPGEAVNGMPAAMVYKGQIVVTGVSYGNAVVCAQPKRGCAGSRCDGQVCRILHDPEVPPTHQYLATYRYLEDTFGADVIVHMGTHGNLEFLPGKGTGLSADCYPDMAIGTVPHLYVYNSDNPPEGVIAKRRSYATLVDHLQMVMTQGGLYDDLEELARYLGEYEQARIADASRAHALEHLILGAVQKAHLDSDMRLPEGAPFEDVVRAAHEALGRIRNTQIGDGMHIFGELPEGGRRVDFINSILRYDAGGAVSLRRTVAAMMGLDLADLLADQGRVCPERRRSYGELREEVDGHGKAFIRSVLADSGSWANDLLQAVLGQVPAANPFLPQMEALRDRILDLDSRISQSQEIEALLGGFDGRYIPAGPSGLITRGRDDVLPTGRNFYTLDPQRVPTKAAAIVGRKLAEALLAKHLREEERMPENVAIHWMVNDIMWADGEGMAQIMHLIGVRPAWQPNGRLKGFEVIPLPELGRPRIDVTIRVSGITRDNFVGCIETVDEAIHTVAMLDEPPEMNFVRKHSLESIAQSGQDASSAEAWREASLRVFSARPGTYQAGVQLAVYASAWKEESDLSDIFVYWNGYAYGKGVFGRESFRELANSLKTVDVTYGKVVSDEYDLFGCCTYFGSHGGMTAAARTLSGRDVATYYGDTREPEHVEVRDLADEIRRVVRTKILNPRWIDGMKRHGYKGAGDISKRIGRVYGWEATTREVDDWAFDDITRTFVLDKEMRDFFQENNPWALEEISRRLLEAAERGLWQADPEVLEGLKESYLTIESWLEENMGDVRGDFQGGSVDILGAEDVADWGTKMAEVKRRLHGGH